MSIKSILHPIAAATVAAASLPTSPAHANDINLERAAVMTHRSQGEVVAVDNGTAMLLRSDDGIFLDLATTGLTPGHAYTLWIVAINAPGACQNSPCTSEDVLKSAEAVKSDLGFADGTIANADGSARFAAFQPVGDLTKAWFGTGLARSDAEIHLVLRDHGPLQLGLERPMLSSFRAGCTEESIADALPETARRDGLAGDYACANVQTAVFVP